MTHWIPSERTAKRFTLWLLALLAVVVLLLTAWSLIMGVPV